MHGTLPARPRAPRPDARLPLVLRLALRELRGGLKGFGIFLACIALGVAAIAGVTSISRSLTEGLTREGRKILGGDMAFSLIHREASPAERAFLEGRGTVSAIASMRAMANAGEKGSGLVELKAVDGAYPTVGTLQTEPQLSTADLLANRDGAFGAAVDAVAELGGARPGDRTMLDALRPAADAFSRAVKAGQSPAEAWAACVREAEQGADATARMQPRLGRASYLGERAIGVPDAGAAAVVVWMKALAPFIG